MEDGNFREKEVRELLSSGEYPCRNIEENLADLAAQVAANETGVREVLKMIEQFGVEVVHSYMRYVQDNAEECVRQVLTSNFFTTFRCFDKFIKKISASPII